MLVTAASQQAEFFLFFLIISSFSLSDQRTEGENEKIRCSFGLALVPVPGVLKRNYVINMYIG